jgi:[acyl-carrier-protein] S-malonyltransferase
MKKAFVFPGQGSQFPKMGLDIYETHVKAKQIFEQANQILGFNISEIMFHGSEDDLKQTQVTQPAIFIHSIALFTAKSDLNDLKPDMVAGHSLGEFSALVAAGCLTFEDGLKLVYMRATAMQKACEISPSSMAAIIGLEDTVVEEVCKNIKDEVVVPANYNYPGQLVISGSKIGVEKACELLKKAGAKRAIILPVNGGFHSPMMEPARIELEIAIKNTKFDLPRCPIYQNVDANPSTSVVDIKNKLIKQLTSPVLWTQSINNMVKDGTTLFVECGPGKVLQGLIKKIVPSVETMGL